MGKSILIVAGAAVLAGTTLLAGGWAVTTVTDVPEYAIAGQPLTLSFAVRQHGVSLAGGITNGFVLATKGTDRVRVPAHAAKQTGFYAADLTLPAPGTWRIAVNIWGERSFELPVVSPGVKVKAMPSAERGATLFAAKGCVSCHVHESFAREPTSIVGPELTGKRYAPEFLSASLQTPRACESGRPCMPKLELDDKEIAALTTFMNK